jgi:hypothetical protein
MVQDVVEGGYAMGQTASKRVTAEDLAAKLAQRRMTVLKLGRRGGIDRSSF